MKYSKKTMMAILEFIVVCLAIVFVFKGIIMPVKLMVLQCIQHYMTEILPLCLGLI